MYPDNSSSEECGKAKAAEFVSRHTRRERGREEILRRDLVIVNATIIGVPFIRLARCEEQLKCWPIYIVMNTQDVGTDATCESTAW